MEEALWTRRGKDGSPIAYVVRDQLIPTASANDPATDYPSIDDELVNRTPITCTETFKSDSMLVLTYLRGCLGGTLMWVRVKHMKRSTKNDRLV